jgi:type II secretory pathway pseudopilin PulG
LIELLAVTAVVAVLAAVTVPVLGRLQSEGRKADEIAAGRKLIVGYQLYASENDGQLMPGYAEAGTMAVDAAGNRIHFPASARYPWRLAPYVNYDMKTFVLEGNRIGSKTDDSHYADSVAPNLGMNVTFVGGDFGSGSDLQPTERAIERFGNFCATRLTQVSEPSKLIVFASARRSKSEIGNFRVQSPFFGSRRWANSWSADQPAGAFGFVDLRYGQRAVAVMLDGHAELLDEDQLQDMRRWSIQAADADDPNFTIRRQ